MTNATRFGAGEVDGARFMAESLSEHAFMANVREYAEAHGWLDYHTHIAKRSAEGFPDLVLVRGGRLVFAELKREKPQHCTPSMHEKLDPTHAQQRWLAELRTVSAYAGPHDDRIPLVGAYLWRPSDWPEIERILE